jgi:glycosyltransferase involved in cell wall biosynthesis
MGSTPIVANDKSSARLFDRVLARPDGFALARATASLVPDLSSRDGALLIDTGHGAIKHPRLLARWRKDGGRVVAFVHDLIPITHPEHSRPGEGDKHRIRMRSALEHSSAIIVNSQATLTELESFAKSETLSVPRTLVAHLGANPTKPMPAPPIAAPYFVIVGTIEARKNHLLLLQVWQRLVAAHGAAAPKLVIVGQRGWEIEQVVDLLERSEPLRDVVIEKPAATDDELASYVQHARALLFPSFAEGYGLPLVEALAVGTPVIASDLPVFRELAGDRPVYLDPLDGPAWQSNIEAVVDAASSRAMDLRARSADFRSPTWREHLSKVDAFLEGIGA